MQKNRFFLCKGFVSSTKTPTFASAKQKHALLAQLVEQLTLNQWVQGSNPWRCTKGVYLTRIDLFYFCSYLGIVLSPLASSNPHLHPTGTHIIQLSSHLQKRTSDKRRCKISQKEILASPKRPNKGFSALTFNLTASQVLQKSRLLQKKERKDLASKNFALSLHPQLSPNEAKVARLAYSSIG